MILVTESWTWGSASILQGCIEWMTGGACPCVHAGGVHFKGSLCCLLNKTAPTNLYDENDIIFGRLSSGFLYLFTWRATKYLRKDTTFQSFKLILVFQFVSHLFYC